jgi:hypothetical protein
MNGPAGHVTVVTKRKWIDGILKDFLRATVIGVVLLTIMDGTRWMMRSRSFASVELVLFPKKKIPTKEIP